MPEISEADYRLLVRYQSIGMPDELAKLPAKVAALEEDNKKQRDEIRDWKAKVPGEGSIVLTGDEAKQYPALKEFGDPAEIAAKLAAADEASAKLADVTWRENARAAAKANGWNEDAFLALPGIRGFDFEIRTEREGEAEVQRAFAVPKEGDDKGPKRLDADLLAARDDWKALRPALEVKPNGDGDGKPAPPWPKQKDTDRGAGGYDPVAAGKAMAEAAKKSADTSLAFK